LKTIQKFSSHHQIELELIVKGVLGMSKISKIQPIGFKKSNGKSSYLNTKWLFSLTVIDMYAKSV
jgi:hypothetical protein